MPLEMLHHTRTKLSSVNYYNHILLSHIMHLDTFDVESISATVVDECTIHIECHFIHRSDALGCKVVLVSDYPNVNNAERQPFQTNTSLKDLISLVKHSATITLIFLSII